VYYKEKPENTDWQHPDIIEAVRRALVEDIGSGDLTTNLCVPDNAKGSGIFLAREPMIVTGVDLLPILYDGEDIEVLFSDGTPIEADVVFARVSGSIRRLLELERTTLNFLQRLCGIAVTTRKFVKAVEGTGCVILDTRKTTPGLRRLEKLATRVGGAWNHRFGLFDAVLIKNNHIAAAGGVQQAVEKAKKQNELPIEIEVRNLTELDEALDAGASHLMLDNFTPELVHQAMRKVTCDVKIEVSGGITAENVREYADAGPDFISIGAITHSAPATDISFRLT
tara:strand:+ start:12691 stop:13536 length:846 start_codon:yes stop_codon:yes gene_type:complete